MAEALDSYNFDYSRVGYVVNIVAVQFLRVQQAGYVLNRSHRLK